MANPFRFFWDDGIVGTNKIGRDKISDIHIIIKKEKEESHALIEILFYSFCVGWTSEKEGKERRVKA